MQCLCGVSLHSWAAAFLVPLVNLPRDPQREEKSLRDAVFIQENWIKQFSVDFKNLSVDF